MDTKQAREPALEEAPKLYAIVVTGTNGEMDPHLAAAMEEVHQASLSNPDNFYNNPQKHREALEGFGLLLAEWQEETGAFRLRKEPTTTLWITNREVSKKSGATPLVDWVDLRDIPRLERRRILVVSGLRSFTTRMRACSAPRSTVDATFLVPRLSISERATMTRRVGISRSGEVSAGRAWKQPRRWALC